jgi:hypothetical protein
MCLVQQREALLLQLVRTNLDGVSVGDLELDARLRHRSISWPIGSAEAGLCSLRQWPDADALATADVFTVQIVIFRPHQWQPKRIHVQPSADAGVRGDHCNTRDELHIHDVTFRHCFDSSDDRRILLRQRRYRARVARTWPVSIAA